MNGEENSQLNKQSKFRFLNPDEKRKLKELNDEILGDSKNINFESNVDLAIQFAPTSYDTQRYNIKKLVDERLSETLVFNSTEVREKLAQEKLEAKKARKVKKKRLIEESKPQMLVTSVERNEEYEEEIIESEEIVNERLAEQTAIIQRELERILKNSSPKVDKEQEEQEEVKQILSVKELDIEMPKKMKDGNPNFVEEITSLERKYLDGIVSSEAARKLELAEEKKKHTKEFFESKDDFEEDKNYLKIKKNRSKIIYYALIVLIFLLVVLIAYKFLQNNYGNTGQDFQEIDTGVNGEVSNYQGEIEIVGSNASSQIMEITDGDFQYVASSNDSEEFNTYVYGNLKNAKPYKATNNLVVLFGKDDSQHFGNLEYLVDRDYYNTFEVKYTYDGETTNYKAISYYKTLVLDNKMYSAFGAVDFINFMNDEIYKSIQPIRSDVIIESDSEILTLVTFDSDNKLYHVLHLASE